MGGFIKGKLNRAALPVLAVVITAFGLLSGCSDGVKRVKLDPKNPVTVTVWHYYNGSILNAFDKMVYEFNETVGMEKGIIVEGYGHGNVTELEKAVISSANKEVGSLDIPNVFASYADTAYQAEEMGILANLGDYFSEKEQQEYLESYIEEGRIGLNGELRIFPIAKSTEIFLLNDTDWQPFAEENGLSYDDLSTVEGIVRVSELYYNWTDGKTPDIPNDGRAFYGRDSIANMFVIGSMEFGEEIFHVENGRGSLNINREVMRKLWDCYYVPYIKGYFMSYGRYRSDDAKVGDLLAYVGSTSSSGYFPSEVTSGGKTYPIEPKALHTPHFENAERTMVQQGAGMVVTKSTPEQEYASVEFLKWFTAVENNIEFSIMSGYMPVKKEAIDYDLMKSKLDKSERPDNDITDETIRIAFDEIKTSKLYTNKAFSGGSDARNVLESNMEEKAVADRAAVVQLLESGMSLEEAAARFDTDENFEAWLESFSAELAAAVKAR